MAALAPKTLAIVGPTASGKSAVALALAEELGGEIVSCDSVQVYRDFTIGCAKPTADERARVPHHLLDVVAWDEPFDAQRYRELATAAIDTIAGRGRVPIVCGGTGLYLRTLRWGLVDLPEADSTARQGLYAEEAAQPGVLYERLRRVDPDTARDLSPNNLVYVVRALEIHALTGEAASVVRARHAFAEERVPMTVVALQWPPTELRQRIVRRTAAMLEAGLVREVEDLLARGVSPDCRPMRAVGYREVVAVLRGEAPRESLAQRIAQSTTAYARRQRTWLRRERDVRFVDVDSDSAALATIRALSHELDCAKGTRHG